MKRSLIIIIFESIILIVLLVYVFQIKNNDYVIVEETSDGYETIIDINDVRYKLYFYPNGKIKRISERENDTCRGAQMSFYENGRLFFYTAIDNKQEPIGDQIFFYSNGRLETIENKSPIEDFPYVFEKISFYDIGNINVDSSRFFIFNAYSMSENNQIKYYLNIQFISGRIVEKRIIQYGSFDENWFINDSTKLHSIEMNNDECEIKLDQLKYGDNIIRGELIEITTNGDTMYTPFSHTIIFAK